MRIILIDSDVGLILGKVSCLKESSDATCVTFYGRGAVKLRNYLHVISGKDNVQTVSFICFKTKLSYKMH